nr:hypothetical protein [Tanacetum cinerariifolium]
MTLETHNWSSSAHQELYKIVKDENFPIVNQVDARVQNFEIQFLKEAAKFVGDFKSLVKEVDESLAKHKDLELEIERLLRAVVSQDIMSVMQKTFVVDTSNLQAELEHTNEHFENYIIKKENEYAKLWNDCLEPNYSKKVFVKKDNTCGTSKNTKFAKQSILGKPPMLDEIHALSKPVTSNSNPTPQESKVMKKDKVIALGMFRINPLKTSREEKHVPNNVRASARIKPITVSQPSVIPKKDKKTANVSIKENQKKRNPKVKKPKKVGFIERLATPKPSTPRSFLRWSPTGRMFDIKGKIVDSSESKCQSNCSKGDNACTSNPVNDHVVAILDFGDLQWGNILITRVYFVEGLGHNLFLLGSSTITLVTRRTDNATEFKNQVLKEYFDYVGISHQMSSVRTPKQNGVVERRNRTLVEAARTMLIFSRALLFLWAEAIATTCLTQNRSIIHRHFNKTPYELINGRKPDITFLHVFGALCYPKNDREDIGKLGAKVLAFEQRSSKPELQSMTSGQISLGLNLTYAPSTITTQQPTEDESNLLFEAMYDDYIGGQPSAIVRTVTASQEPQVRQTSTASTSIAVTAPSPTNSSSHATYIPITSQDVDELNPNAMFDGNSFVNPFTTSSTSAAESSSSQNVDPSNMHTFYQPYPHEFQ